MKKFISIFTTAVLFVMCLANPVSAAEVGSVGAVDLLGLGYIEVNGSNVENMRVNLSAARSGSIWFPVDVPFGLGEFELLVMSSDPSLTFKRSDNAVTYEKFESGLGDNYYVVRGNFSGRGKTLNYTSSGSSSGDYFFVVSAKAMPLNYEIVEIPFNFRLFDEVGNNLADEQQIYSTVYSDDIYYDEFDDMYRRQIHIYPNKDMLAGLDYFDLDIFMQNLEITSISASFGGNALEVLTTEQIIGDGIFNDPINTGEYDKDKTYGIYKVVVRVDVSGINLMEGSPTVFINYAANNYGSVRPQIYIFGINAGKFWHATDANTTYLFRIWNKLNSGFASMVSNFSALANRMESAFDSNFTKLGVWFTNQNTLIQNKINDLHSMLVNKFDSLEAAILGKKEDGEELSSGAQQIQDSVDNISRFEEDQQAILDNNFSAIQSAVSVTGFAASLAFVQRYTEGIFLGMGNTFIIFTLPLFLGLFFFICSRIPGATRWRSRPPKDGDG